MVPEASSFLNPRTISNSQPLINTTTTTWRCKKSPTPSSGACNHLGPRCRRHGGSNVCAPTQRTACKRSWENWKRLSIKQRHQTLLARGFRNMIQRIMQSRGRSSCRLAGTSIYQCWWEAIVLTLHPQVPVPTSSILPRSPSPSSTTQIF